MSDVRDLYQEVILDHSKHPQNFHKPDGANRTAEGFNPLCGDTVNVHVKLDADVIADIGFEGSGCAISKASASLMTVGVKGKTKAQAGMLFDSFHAMITKEPNTALDPALLGSLGKLAVFSGVREYPARIKCATLAWHTLKAALEGKEITVSTESLKESGGVMETKVIQDKVVAAIRSCYDPEIPVNIYDLGLIYDVIIDPTGAALVKMTLTSPNCPAAASLPAEVHRKVGAVEGVTTAKVDIVWDPPWTPAKMSEAAKLELGMM